jgi:hypothetical protein
VVVPLGIAEARVLATSDMPMGFLDWLWRIVAEAVGGFHTLVVVGTEGLIFGSVVVVKVEVDGWGYFRNAGSRTEALAYAPIGGGSQWCTGAM